MSKQDYEVIAQIIRLISDPETRWWITDGACKILLAKNPGFNVAKFQKACKAEGKTYHENVMQRAYGVKELPE